MNYRDISYKIINGEKIHNIKLKVCFYARVSTDNEEQLNSLENQKDYYRKLIETNPNWTYINGYIDEGISGVSVNKRKAFKEMIKDAKMNKFDMIITKEVSRFARDLEDSIHYIRLLKDYDVGVYFENQNINTYDTNSELILNIMFNIAQEESKKLSSRIKFGHKEAIKKGHVLGSSNILGYKKNNCKLVIDEEEAKKVRKIFELYSTGDYGLYKLSKTLGEHKIYNSNGNLYDKDTLKRIISNPKYKGFYRGKTTEVTDYRTKKRIIIDKNDQVIYKSCESIVPAIVSEEIWNEANKILEQRTNKYMNKEKRNIGLKYPLSSKIFCAEHNKTFQRTCSNKRITWCCSKYLQYSISECKTAIINEKDIYNIFIYIMNNVIKNKEKLINNIYNIYENIDNKKMYEKELEEISKKIEIIENKKNMLLDFIFNGELKKEDLKIQFKKYNEEIEKIKIRKKYINNQINIVTQEQKSNIINESVKEELEGNLKEEFIKKFTDKIIVSRINNDRKNIKLDIYLNLYGKNDYKRIIEKHNFKSIEKLRKDITPNIFTIFVYVR